MKRNDRSDSDDGALGGRVRGRRRALGLTQEQVADLAGCSARFLGELEDGKATVRLDKVLSVLDVLGLEIALALRRTP